MPYAIYEIDDKGNPVDDRICTGWDYTPVQPIATITDAEMMDLGTMKVLRFAILMNSGIGSLLDKLDPIFSKLSESKLDRRLSELKGSK